MSTANKVKKHQSKSRATDTLPDQVVEQANGSEGMPNPAQSAEDIQGSSLSSVCESTIGLNSSGYLISDGSECSEETLQQPDFKFGRTVSVPADAEILRTVVPEESAAPTGQTPRAIAMKKRSQSACKT